MAAYPHWLRILGCVALVFLLVLGGCGDGLLRPAPAATWRVQYTRAAQRIQAHAPDAVLESIDTSQEKMGASPADLDFDIWFTFIEPSGKTSTSTVRFPHSFSTHIAQTYQGSSGPRAPAYLVVAQAAPATIAVGPLDAITLTWSSAISTALQEGITLYDVGTSLYIGERWQRTFGIPYI